MQLDSDSRPQQTTAPYPAGVRESDSCLHFRRIVSTRYGCGIEGEGVFLELDEGIDGLWSGPTSSSFEDGFVNLSMALVDATVAPLTLVEVVVASL